MIEHLLDSLTDALLDTLKILPFLFLTYLIMEWLEHKTGSRTQAAIRRAGKMGPFFGGILGVFPQCGFSAAAANLYAGGLITAGTLTAVFLSTSDEMLPIFISEAVPVGTVIRVLAAKMMIGIVSGFLLDFLYHRLLRREHCRCEEGIFTSAVRHTLQITLFILAITAALNILIEWVGEERLSGLVLNTPVAGELIAGVIGLIPNCASSVVITRLYLEGIIGAGPMITGLLAGAGVGVLLLCRMNHGRVKQNAGIIVFLYTSSVLWGILIDYVGVIF